MLDAAQRRRLAAAEAKEQRMQAVEWMIIFAVALTFYLIWETIF